jgi:hypothetical protein
MPRPKKTSQQSNDQDLTSKNTRRKRTPSAEMAGMNDDAGSKATSKRSTTPKSKTERNHEYESPEKRRGYEENLRDDYSQEGARYGSSREGRGTTEFNYDRQHFGATEGRQQGDQGYQAQYGGYQGHQGYQQQQGYQGGYHTQQGQGYDRDSYTNPGIESDYRNRRSGSADYRSEYMNERGDVPSGGYYGYERMQGRTHGDYGDTNMRRTGGRGPSDAWDAPRGRGNYSGASQEHDYYGQAGTWHHEAAGRGYQGNQDRDEYQSNQYRGSRSGGYYDDRGPQQDYRMNDRSSQQRFDQSGRGQGNYYDRYENDNRYRNSQQGQQGQQRDNWQSWNDDERRMMDRRRGGYPKNTGGY